jgi:hypothetical protein
VGGPVASANLHYETASNLMLRRVLDLGTPQHRAILLKHGDASGWPPPACLLPACARPCLAAPCARRKWAGSAAPDRRRPCMLLRPPCAGIQKLLAPSDDEEAERVGAAAVSSLPDEPAARTRPWPAACAL